MTSPTTAAMPQKRKRLPVIADVSSKTCWDCQHFNLGVCVRSRNLISRFLLACDRFEPHREIERTCGRCSQFRKGCVFVDVLGDNNVCGATHNGWDIEWQGSGVEWVPDFAEDKSGHVILLNWQLRKESVRNKCGFESLGKLRHKRDGWIAIRYGQPILEWKRSIEALKHCARALVAAWRQWEGKRL